MSKTSSPTYKKIRRLKKKADKLWGEVVLVGEPKCLACIVRKSTHPHHFFPKSIASRLRLDVENGVGMCFICHQRLHATNDPEIVTAIIGIKGMDWFNRLRRKRTEGRGFHFTIGYLEDKIEELENES